MNLEFEISDDPISSLKRKARLAINPINYEAEFTKMQLLVSYWENDSGNYGNKVSGNAELDPKQRFSEYEVVIIAGEQMINPSTQQEMPKRFFDAENQEVEETEDSAVRWEYEEGGISEFLFYSSIKPSDVGLENPSLIEFLNTLYGSIIQTADIKNRFN